MATVASPAPRRAAIAGSLSLPIPIWAAVACSRLLVLGAGVTGALLTHRVPGWQQFDPTRISSSLGPVGNVLAAPALRWDGIRYVNIAEHGYTSAASTVSFPLYSLLIRVVSWVVLSPVIAGALISVVCFGAALAMIRSIAREELGPRAADATVLLLALAPLSFFFTAVYTESLFMAFSVGAFYLARRQRLTLACLAAAGASLTHVEGVLLVAPLALIWWRDQQPGPSLRDPRWRGALPLGLPPLALAGFLTYLHSQGWGWLAPVTNDNVRNYGRLTLTTPVLLWRALGAGITGLSQTLHGAAPIAPSIAAPFNVGFQNTIYLVVLAISVSALVVAWRRLPREYAIYATLVFFVCTWTGVSGRPLEAFDRYMLPVFPLWMAAAAWLQERRLLSVVLPVSSILLVFYTVEFARWVFIA